MPGAPLQEQHHTWPAPSEYRKGPRKPYHDHDEHFNNGDDDHESDTDDDDSKDENDDDSENDNDDDSEDEDNDDGDDSSESQSGSGSPSGSGSGNDTESAAIQSSVVTNVDGVNIGNTITIINIGNGSGGQLSSSAPAGNEPNGSNPFAVDADGRSAITSSAARAFCDSIGCGFGQVSSATTSASGSLSATFSLRGGNESRSNEATYEIPSVTSGGSSTNMEVAAWLLIVSILAQYL